MIHFIHNKTPDSMDIDELAGELEAGRERKQANPVAFEVMDGAAQKRLDAVEAEYNERKDREFHVIEYSSGFAVRHRESGEEHWMSDGVDVMFDEDDHALSPGSEGFVRKWEDAMNEPGSETLEAYFPQFVEN